VSNQPARDFYFDTFLMFRTRLLYPQKSLPLLVEPEETSAEGRSVSSLIQSISANRAIVESWLYKHGAVLFRGFSIDNIEELNAVVRAIQRELLDYIEGDSPRTKISGQIYTSTEYPETYQISLHNELSYTHKWPSKIFFYCAVPPDTGGETPIVDCRKVLQSLDSQLRKRFIDKKVRYVNNLHGGDRMGKSWQDTFETGDKSKIEEYLTAGGIDFNWDDQGGLHTSQVRQAVITHPVTGEQVWFNQVEQWHPSTLDEKNRRAMAALGLKEENLPHYASFGDGSSLDEEELKQIRMVMREQAVYFPWQKSDLLVLDNVLVAHGRNSFKGPRKILVAMG
jgi:alpha-ketoglutarate-dependent taurine dioxygenase